MIGTGDLPHVNATLNAIAALLLAAGRLAILGQRRELHRRLMIAAFVVSSAFLVSYVVYHSAHGSTRFLGTGWVRTGYLTLLASHVVLAVAVPPLAIAALYRAQRGELERHRRIVAYAWPIWMYVSVTGVVVYVILYQIGPSSG